ncbi:TPA: DUF2891 domain-containing protein [Elizabethkingia meningoseptica]|nr:DUF2891 domain-containing protein [Elizabethkingia meningoseptica]
MKRYSLLAGIGFVCAQGMAAQTSSFNLNEQLAKKILTLPAHCIRQEYPNKLGQEIGSEADLKTPKQLRPVFYGCFDWHSSVHGYWSIAVLLKKYPALDLDGKIRVMLNQDITPENVQKEVLFFQDKNNTSFERTYGWAWFLKLQEALYGWKDSDAQRWHSTFKPLEKKLVESYKAYLPKLLYPIRTGQHDNTAFGLTLALEYARSVQNKEFENIITEAAKRLFSKDINCNLAYEPGGNDFLSPCLEEALLMSKVMPQQEYRIWLKSFMPELFNKTFQLQPGVVSNRTDGKLVHLDGLNFSRAACFVGIAKALPELQYLKKLGDQHFNYSIKSVSTADDYMGSHWLGTFALHAVME